MIIESLVFSERVRSLNQYITWCQKRDLSKQQIQDERDQRAERNSIVQAGVSRVRRQSTGRPEERRPKESKRQESN